MNPIQFPGAPVAAGTITERSQREEARAARREVILDAARRVFATRGFRGTTIADIAEEAKIALGTIYLYFPSKEDVFAALSERFSAMIVNAITDVPQARSLEETVRQRVDNVFVACAGNRDLVRLVVLNTDPESAVAARMRASEAGRAQPMADELRTVMEAGAIRQGDPAIMAKLIAGLVSIAVYQAFVLSDGRDADKFRSACADMALAYLTPQPATTA
jgi:AcrR family transcriptional regulator